MKYTFETMELDDRIVAVPVGDSAEKFHAVIRLNDSAAEIFKLLKNETTEDAIITEMKKLYGDKAEIVEFVHEFIENLYREGVLA